MKGADLAPAFRDPETYDQLFTFDRAVVWRRRWPLRGNPAHSLITGLSAR